MVRIPYISTGFAESMGQDVCGSNTCECGWPDVVWAAITVGRASWSHVVGYGLCSDWEIIYRAAIVYANLTQGVGGYIHKSAAYIGLDPSEKGAVSYFLGLMSAKLLSERYLDVPWLLHLDRYRDLLDVELASGRSRPDLVGRSLQDKWIALEAKGRSDKLGSGIVDGAVSQARRVTGICGGEPEMRIGLACYFDNGRFMIDWRDPPSDRESVTKPSPSTERFLAAYYAPFVELLKRHGADVAVEATGGRRFVITALSDADMVVGLDGAIIDATSYSDSLKTLADGDQRPSASADPHQKIGRDGVLVRLGPRWSDERMTLQPQERIA